VSEPERPRYSVRLQERALRDVDAAFVGLAEFASEAIAHAWRAGLSEVVSGLAENPRRHPRVPEHFLREVRQALYRRPGSRVAYRILFTLTGEEADALEGPTVTVFHVRHASARSITRTEARELERGV